MSKHLGSFSELHGPKGRILTEYVDQNIPALWDTVPETILGVSNTGTAYTGDIPGWGPEEETSQYPENKILFFTPHVPSNAGAHLSISGLPLLPILHSNGTAIDAGELSPSTTAPYWFLLTGSSFINLGLEQIGSGFSAQIASAEFETQTQAAAHAFGPEPNIVRVHGRSAIADGGSATYHRVISSPHTTIKFPSLDGAIWEQSDRDIDLRATDLIWDTPSHDNGPLFQTLIEEAAAAGRRLIARVPGTLYLGNVDAHALNHVIWDFIPGVIFHGLPSFDGPVISVRGAPDGTPGGPFPYEFQARNLSIDNSERPFTSSAQSGTALALAWFNFAHTVNFRAYAGTDYRGVMDTGTGLRVQHGDSGLTQSSCNHSLHENFFARGQPDNGLYISGDPGYPADPVDPPDYSAHPGDPGVMDRGGHTLINPMFFDCTAGCKATRLARRFRIFGGEVVRASEGVQNRGIQAGNLTASPEMIIVGLHGKKLVSRLITVGPNIRATIIGAQLEDWAHQPYDATFDSEPSGATVTAYAMEGASNVLWLGCRAWFRDWNGMDDEKAITGFKAMAYTNPTDGVTYQSTDNIFESCIVEGSNRAFEEHDLSDRNRGTIYHRAVGGHPFYMRIGSSSQVRNGNQSINQLEIHTGDADYPVVRDDVPNHRFTGPVTRDKAVDFELTLPNLMPFYVFHFSNETTGGHTVVLRDLGAGAASTHALASGQWADLIWDGTTLEVYRTGTLLPS